MRILITGGAGFLGQAVAARARAAGHAVTTVDRGGADHDCDIGNTAAVEAVVIETMPDAVVHLAAMLTDGAAADPVAATRVNALGTAAVFAAALKVEAKSVVYASSVAAVGICPEGSGDAVPLAPQTVYGVTKAFGEHLARAMSIGRDAPAFVALRFGWIYGPGRERGWRVAQDVIERFARGDQKILYPDFHEATDWTYIDDAAEIVLRAVERPPSGFSAFNVVGDRRRIADMVAHLCRRFPGVRAEPVPASTPASGWGIRNDGLEAALGFVPDTRLEDGLDGMLAAIAKGG
jgi:nucleoside-diphosphate-sugar epimerase